jgi:formylglycine-generating enzyme required for sulfatase activity
MELVWIPSGSFMMGSENGRDNEKPVHQVTIKEGFYMGKYEVTQAQWQKVMGSNPSNFKGESLPVEKVSWLDAQEFISKLNAMNDGYTYRLPAESEWEYAGRAGTTGDYAGDLDSMAWYVNNAGRKYLDPGAMLREKGNYLERVRENGNQTHPVGQKQPNGFGLYDMHGNVWEWCQDWSHDDYNGGAPTDGSAWLSGGGQRMRVLRGGSWGDLAERCRSASRDYLPSDFVIDSFGLRVVAVARTQ